MARFWSSSRKHYRSLTFCARSQIPLKRRTKIWKYQWKDLETQLPPRIPMELVLGVISHSPQPKTKKSNISSPPSKTRWLPQIKMKAGACLNYPKWEFLWWANPTEFHSVMPYIPKTEISSRKLSLSRAPKASTPTALPRFKAGVTSLPTQMRIKKKNSPPSNSPSTKPKRFQSWWLTTLRFPRPVPSSLKSKLSA